MTYKGGVAWHGKKVEKRDLTVPWKLQNDSLRNDDWAEINPVILSQLLFWKPGQSFSCLLGLSI